MADIKLGDLYLSKEESKDIIEYLINRIRISFSNRKVLKRINKLL